VVATRLDAADDAQTYPQYVRDHDAAAFATPYTRFVRAITEHPFFRSLDADRSAADRATVVEQFYAQLRNALEAEPTTAVWHVMSLRLRRRPHRPDLGAQDEGPMTGMATSVRPTAPTSR